MVSFNATFYEWLEGYRVGLRHMGIGYWIFWSLPVPLVFGGIALILYSKGYPSSWPPTALPPRPVLLSMKAFLEVFLFTSIPMGLLSGYLYRNRSVQLLPQHLVWQRWLKRERISWEYITDILDTGFHLCFCRNTPCAIVVPKSAFASDLQAGAFLHQAEEYWRLATKRTGPPLTTGVWPPPPTPSNSVEPGAAP